MPDCKTAPFSGCEYSKNLICKIIDEYNITQFVETGTFMGHTTQFIADHYPNMKIFTVEVNETYYRNVLNKFQKYSNIKINLGSSDEFLKNFDNSKIPTLYYLDAHWYESNPLNNELINIQNKSEGNDIIIIDDFKVPNRSLSYDPVSAIEDIDMDYIKNCLDWNKWNFFYKDCGINDVNATGQIYIIGKQFDINKIPIKIENNIWYSDI